MKMETEITVLVKSDYETLRKVLLDNGFSVQEEYQIDDVYMINKDIDLSKLSDLEILSKCILVRDVYDTEKVLLYKYKEYAENGDIIRQGKVKCPIDDIDKGIKFMNAINYIELFKIRDKCIVYANKETQLVVQLVNDEYIFIEMEAENEYTNKVYNSIDELKEEINKYDLPIDKNNYFVKKAELILKKTLKR